MAATTLHCSANPCPDGTSPSLKSHCAIFTVPTKSKVAPSHVPAPLHPMLCTSTELQPSFLSVKCIFLHDSCPKQLMLPSTKSAVFAGLHSKPAGGPNITISTVKSWQLAIPKQSKLNPLTGSVTVSV